MNDRNIVSGGASAVVETFRLGLAVLALTLAGTASLLRVNDYAAQGIGSAHDCDGPVGIGLFLFPSIFLGIIVVAWCLRGGRHWVRHVALAASVLALAIGLSVLPGWYTEMQRNAASGSPCR